MSKNFEEGDGQATEQLEQQGLYEELVALILERCRGCSQSETVVLMTVADVQDGSLTEDEARARVSLDSRDLRIKCVLGKKVVGDLTICNYDKKKRR